MAGDNDTHVAVDGSLQWAGYYRTDCLRQGQVDHLADLAIKRRRVVAEALAGTHIAGDAPDPDMVLKQEQLVSPICLLKVVHISLCWLSET